MESLSFYKLCRNGLDEICMAKNHKSKSQILNQIVKEFRVFEGDNQSLFPLLRLFLPTMDKDRQAYGMKEAKIVDLYIKCLGLSKESQVAMKLKSWKQHHNDLSVLIESVIKERLSPAIDAKSYTIASVNALLDQLQESNDDDERIKILRPFIIETSALENKWFIRIILKDLRLGLGKDTILRAIHPQAPSYSLVCGSLSLICDAYLKPENDLNVSNLILFSPFSPMLAQRLDFESFEKLIGGSNFYLETKLDGTRIQLHKKGSDYRYFSRNLHDYTYLFGSSPDEGSLSCEIHDYFLDNVDSVILDGEMMVYDKESDLFATFGKLVGASKPPVLGGLLQSGSTNDSLKPCFVVFDVLHLNGVSLLNTPLNKRLDVLENNIFKMTKRGTIELMKRITSSNLEAVKLALDNAIANFEEGLVLKKIDSFYELGSRPKSWFKIKPEYISGLVEDLDLLVVGCKFGKRMTGLVSSFYLAIIDNESGKLLTFAKVGSGYSYKELKELNGLILPGMKTFHPSDIPTWLDFSGEKPDLIIKDFKKATVFCVKASQIVPSESFAAKFTLRFPRFSAVRPDKPWNEILSLEEMLELKDKAAGNLAHTNVSSIISKSVITNSSRKRIKATIHKAYDGVNPANVPVTGTIFSGSVFLVIKGDALSSKQEIERLLIQEDAQVVQNITASSHNVTVISGDKNGPRVKDIMSVATFDIVTCDWVRKCIAKREILPILPKYSIFATKETESKFKLYVDRYGDSFTELYDFESFKKFINDMENKGWKNLVERRQISSEIAQRYLNDQKLSAIYGVTVYVDPQNLEHNDFIATLQRKRLLSKWVRMGLDVKYSNSENCTHIVIFSTDEKNDFDFEKKIVKIKICHDTVCKWLKLSKIPFLEKK